MDIGSFVWVKPDPSPETRHCRAWVGQIVEFRKDKALVRYCNPNTPESLKDLALKVEIPIKYLEEL